MLWRNFLYNHYKAILAGFIFTFFFLVYIRSTPPHLTGYGDAEELVTVAFVGGVAHPPGYALYTFILQQFISYSPLSPIYTANLVSALFHALALGIMAYSIATLLSHHHLKPIEITAATAGAIVITGLTRIIWLSATRAEVHAMTALLVSLLILLYSKYVITNDHSGKQKKFLYSLACLYGITLAHIQTAILFIPGLFVLLLQRRSLKKLGLSIACVGIAFFITHSLLFLQNQRQASVSWAFDQTLEGWYNHITRADYAGTFVEQGVERGAYWAGLPPYFIHALLDYPQLLRESYHWLILVIISVGAFFIFKEKKWLWLPLMLFFVCSGWLLYAYMGLRYQQVPEFNRDMAYGIGERQFVIGFYALTPLLALGFSSALQVLTKIMRWQFATIAVLILGMYLGLNLYTSNHSKIVLANKPLVDEYAKKMLASVKSNSVIICDSDIACFSLIYLSIVEHQRPDVTILFKNSKMRQYTVIKETYAPFLRWENPAYVSDLLMWNLLSRPVYYTNPTDFYIDYLGLNGDPLYLVPHMYGYEVLEELPTNIEHNPDYSLTKKLITLDNKYLDSYMNGLKHYIAGIHVLNGTLLLNYGKSVEARTELEYALALVPDSSLIKNWLVMVPQYSNDDTYYAKKSAVQTIKTIQSDSKRETPQTIYQNARKLLIKDPLNTELRLLIIESLMQMGNHEQVKQELNHLLNIDPKNQKAKELLSNLVQPVLE